jgi:hypothetical protein
MLRNYVQIDEPTRSRQTKLIITPKHEQIFSAILKHRGLTVEQVTSLFYKPGSLTYVRVNLKELVDNKYLKRMYFPTPGAGASPFVYSLNNRGIHYLVQRDLYLDGYKPIASGNYYFLLHLLMLNDFAISASLLPRLNLDITLSSWLHEWQLKQLPVSAKVNNTEVSSVPDLWFDFTVRAGSQKKPYQMPLWVEIDMGTEWGKKFKDKLTDIVHLVTEQAYEQRFGVKQVTVAFATPGTIKRRDLMRQHIKTVLEELGKLRFADLFLFASLPQGLDPKTVFLSPIWYTPTSDTPLSLLDLSD